MTAPPTAETAGMVDDYRAKLVAALPLDTPDVTIDELKRGLEVLVEAVRKECFALSPATKLLLELGAFGHIQVGAMAMPIKSLVATLHTPDGCTGCGNGNTFEEAVAALLNDLTINRLTAAPEGGNG